MLICIQSCECHYISRTVGFSIFERYDGQSRVGVLNINDNVKFYWGMLCVLVVVIVEKYSEL